MPATIKPPLLDLVAPTASYRQLDYWVKQGYVRLDEPSPGSGNCRVWTPDELRVAHRIDRLVSVGFILPAAAELARRPGRVWPLGRGITLVVDP